MDESSDGHKQTQQVDQLMDKSVVTILSLMRQHSLQLMAQCTCPHTRHIVDQLIQLNHQLVTNDPNHTITGQTPLTHHSCDECVTSFESSQALTDHLTQCHQYFDANTSLAIELNVIDTNTDSFLDKLNLSADDSTAAAADDHTNGSHSGNAIHLAHRSAIRSVKRSVNRVGGRQKCGSKGSKYYKTDHKYQCEECFNWLPSETALETHCNKHHKNCKPFACQVCGDAFFANLSLLNHLSQSHQMSAFACNQCHYKTRTKHHLIQHMITHSMDRPYKCYAKGCDKSFKRKFELIRHNILHKKRFECRQCKHTFKDNPHLLTHLSTSHQVSLYECHLCPYKTRIKHHLIQHTVTHSNERPFECHIHGCNVRFKRKDMLIRHERLHQLSHNQ